MSTPMAGMDSGDENGAIAGLKHRVVVVPEKEAMHHTFFRLIHRARSRSQRRRIYVWLACIVMAAFLLLYSKPNSFIVYRLPDAGDELMPAESPDAGKDQGPVVGRVPANVKPVVYMKQNPNSDLENEGDLLPDLAPATVHFVWCGKGRHFEYRHYLSVKRANQIIKPDKIMFHYQTLPVEDSEFYYTWFNQTMNEIDHIVLRPINTTSCDTSGQYRYIMIFELLEAFGGIYVPEDSILIDFPVHLRASEFVSGVVAKTLTEYKDGIIVSKKNAFKSPSNQIELNLLLSTGRSAAQGSLEPCGSIDHFNMEEEGDCICVKVGHEIFPRDIWPSETNFGMLARLAGYGLASLKPRVSSKALIPKIGHYICWDCELKFHSYVSVISALYVAGLSKVYIHGPKRPSGPWWAKLDSTKRVTHVYREYPENSHDRATMTQELAQGIMRVSILLKYGGVYCDSRVIWTQPIPDNYFTYDAVASPDWHEYGSWPDSMSHTTIMAKPNSEYLHKLRILHYQKHKQRFWFVDQFLAYKILEQNPQLLYLDRHFQVKCRNQNCHPTWFEDYRVPFNENPPGPQFNWNTDTLSVYWDVFPDLELDTVKYTSGPVVDAARRVFHLSGISVQELTNR